MTLKGWYIKNRLKACSITALGYESPKKIAALKGGTMRVKSSRAMAKKKKQANKSNLTFRERFELNTQKSVPRGAKRAIKTSKRWQIILWIMFSGFMVVLVMKSFQADEIEISSLACRFLAFSGIFTALFFTIRWMSSTYKETKILHGDKVARWTVRTRRGYARRVRLLPARDDGSHLVLIGFLVALSLFIGLAGIATIRGFLIKLPDNPLTLGPILILLIQLAILGIFQVSLVKAFLYLRKQNLPGYHITHKPLKTIVELDEHPLQIGCDYQIWIEQPGNYQNCHLECYMVMIKTERSQRKNGKSSNTQEFQTECAKHLVVDMRDSIDITHGSPLKHAFTLSLEPDDYVPSVWFFFSPSEVQQFDWVLRVFLVSDDDDVLAKTGNSILIQREFPLVLVG